jgi:hypothetical protein
MLLLHIGQNKRVSHGISGNQKLNVDAQILEEASNGTTIHSAVKANIVENRVIETLTSCMLSRRSTN